MSYSTSMDILSEVTTYVPCTKDNEEPADQFGTALSRDLTIYISPCVFCIGLIGNMLTLVVMSRRNLRDSSTTIYLRCIAVLDTMVILTGLLPRWIKAINDIDIRLYGTWICKWLTFITYWGAYSSIWLLVVCSIDRCLLVMNPLHFGTARSKKGTALVIMVVITCSFGLNVIFLIGVDVVRDIDHWMVCLVQCTMTAKYGFVWSSVWPWLELILKCLLPFTLLLASHCAIVVRVSWRNHLRKPGPSDVGTTTWTDLVTSLTATLVAISVAFLFFTIPICAYYIRYNFIYVDLPPSRYAEMELFFSIAGLLHYTHFACNFPLYVITAPRFRREFLLMMSCRKRVHPSPTYNDA